MLWQEKQGLCFQSLRTETSRGSSRWRGRRVGVSNSPSYVPHPAAQLAFIYFFFHLCRGHLLTFILSRSDSPNTHKPV